MRIETHNGLREPQVLDVTRVVVYDDYDNPVALAVEVDGGIIIAETAANEAEFNALLRGLGIDRTVIVHDSVQRPLPQINIK